MKIILTEHKFDVNDKSTWPVGDRDIYVDAGDCDYLCANFNPVGSKKGGPCFEIEAHGGEYRDDAGVDSTTTYYVAEYDVR